MDGYKLVKAFYAHADQNEAMQLGCTGNHHSLYTWICELRNQIQATSPTREIMDLPVRYTMEKSFIGSDHTLKKCTDDLEKWGIIEIVQRGTNQHTPTKIKLHPTYLLSHKCDSDAIAMRKQSDSNAKAVRPTKTVKTSKTEQTDSEQVPNRFTQFWDLYDKKVDRKKCEAKFSKLSESDQQAIIIHVPDYVKAHHEVKFRKDPLTYLNGENWKDPIKPSTGTPKPNGGLVV